MKLITETIEDIEVLTEATTNGGKSYKIRGVFMQAELRTVTVEFIQSKLLQKKSRDIQANSLIRNEHLAN